MWVGNGLTETAQAQHLKNTTTRWATYTSHIAGISLLWESICWANLGIWYHISEMRLREKMVQTQISHWMIEEFVTDLYIQPTNPIKPRMNQDYAIIRINRKIPEPLTNLTKLNHYNVNNGQEKRQGMWPCVLVIKIYVMEGCDWTSPQVDRRFLTQTQTWRLIENPVRIPHWKLKGTNTSI